MVAISLKTSALPNPVDVTQQEQIVDGYLTLTGNYPLNGDTVAFGTLDAIKSGVVPTRVEVFEEPPAGTAPTGYQYTYCPGTTINNGVVAILGSLGTQFATGAYSAGLLAAVIRFRAWFPRGE